MSDYQTGRNMTSPFRLCLVRLGPVMSNNLTGLNLTNPLRLDLVEIG